MTKIENKFLFTKYPDGAVAIGYLLIGLSIISYIQLRILILSLLILTLALYLAFSHIGILIDQHNRGFKYYESKFGFKTGNWESLENYPYVSLLSLRQKQTTYSHTNAHNTSRFMTYQVHLLNEKHTVKYILKEFRDKESAEIYLNRFAAEFGLEISVYSPDFS